ncbi:hypothetical protein COLO4_11909 [Corchorus olitorius]|uniref:Uncharacterized protein n=1 Tax=Corchorus olitorius TaxID=93759 RepID=A0A1R3K2T5_9ROSI|nr:hypothetical protein COLO4_11909 [Corchorus olitorius]
MRLLSSEGQTVVIDPTTTGAQISSWLPNNAPAGNRTRVCTVAGYYSTTRPLVLVVIISQNVFKIAY